LPFNFCLSPDFVSQQSRAFSFSFCAELFSFSLYCSAGLRRVSQKKKIFKKIFLMSALSERSELHPSPTPFKNFDLSF